MVFPTHVGVFPYRSKTIIFTASLPHTRGGVSGSPGRVLDVRWSSPHTWGCFLFLRFRLAILKVFPTHVGVFLTKRAQTRDEISLPHTRGGVSPETFLVPIASVSSPHTWGCFYTRALFYKAREVFPTHVGVFPHTLMPALNAFGLPHTRGGVSIRIYLYPTAFWSSPHTWGCFQK